MKAQSFIQKANIEFEVKTNFKKSMGNSSWDQMMQDKLPAFKTVYFRFVFEDNHSNYQFDHWQDKEVIPEFMRKSEEESVWYMDHNESKLSMRKTLYGSIFNVQDSFPKITWKLSNENRVIAGYNCRKATGIIMDSVYIFAFYTDEIAISGGPCSVNGLPGMILGMTIPRMYASWIATKVNTSNLPVFEKKTLTSKNFYTLKTMGAALIKGTKDWGSSDDAESKKWIDQLTWNMLL